MKINKGRKDGSFEAHDKIGEVPGYLEQRRWAKASDETDEENQGASDDVGGAPTNLEKRATKKY